LVTEQGKARVACNFKHKIEVFLVKTEIENTQTEDEPKRRKPQ
jgi:hypothetical protein